LKKAHKKAVKEENRERRKNKVPKHVKKRKEKVLKTRHSK
jgi:RIO kinase 1